MGNSKDEEDLEIIFLSDSIPSPTNFVFRISSYIQKKFPEYNFQKNKGYPTKDHIEVIKTLGPSPCHRLTFKPELYDESLL